MSNLAPEIYAITNAASAAAHAAAKDALQASFGREPSHEELGRALAITYGDMLSIMAVSGVATETIMATNKLCLEAQAETYTKLTQLSCAGAA